MTPPIQMLAEKVRMAMGLEYRLAAIALKAYMDDLTDIEFAKEVDRIDNEDIIRYLFAAGMPARRQSVVTLKWSELRQ